MTEAKDSQVGVITELIVSKRDLDDSLGQIRRTCRNYKGDVY
jgi:hypothetical protein